jgi:Rad3-related DNA helicase
MILDILSSSARFILLKAPTGSGKTVINWCSAKLHGDRFMYLVSTRELQSQLMRDTHSSGMFDLRGHSNYSCAGRNADDEFSCEDRSECQYRDAVRESLSYASIETNYAHWFVPTLADDASRFGKFDCLICDEMHLINDRLCQAVGFSLSESSLKAMRVERSLPQNLRSLSVANFRDVATEIRAKLHKLVFQGDGKSNPNHSKQLKLIQALTRFIKDSESTIEWAVDVESKNVLSFSPVWSSHYAEKFLFRGIKKVILSSATAKESDLKRIGISANESEVFEMPSSFDPKRGPIVFISKEPHIIINNKIDEPRRRQVINRIDQLLEFHFDRGDKGIIQCTSYDWMMYLKKHSKLSTRIIAHQRGESRDAVSRYRSSKIPLVLASPSIKEGVDFANEACRFIIVVNLPFLNLHIKPNLSQARARSDKTYSMDETARSFEQAIGRGRRNKKDYCVVYVMDARVTWFIEQANLSKHVKAAYRKSVAPVALDFAA